MILYGKYIIVFRLNMLYFWLHFIKLLFLTAIAGMRRGLASGAAALDRVATSQPTPLPAGEKPPVQIQQEALWTPEPVLMCWQRDILLLLPGSDPPPPPPPVWYTVKPC
jgi:hypothetical protein